MAKDASAAGAEPPADRDKCARLGDTRPFSCLEVLIRSTVEMQVGITPVCYTEIVDSEMLFIGCEHLMKELLCGKTETVLDEKGKPTWLRPEARWDPPLGGDFPWVSQQLEVRVFEPPREFLEAHKTTCPWWVLVNRSVPVEDCCPFILAYACADRDHTSRVAHAIVEAAETFFADHLPVDSDPDLLDRFNWTFLAQRSALEKTMPKPAIG
jgi:hypothetical protein